MIQDDCCCGETTFSSSSFALAFNHNHSMTTTTPSTSTSNTTSTWRLSHILKGHSSDVKCVRTFTVQDDRDPTKCTESILTASRDETGKSWSRSICTTSNDGPKSHSRSIGGFVEGPTFKGNRYANSVASLDPCPQVPQGLFVLGSLDSVTRVFLPSSSQDPPKLIQELTSHHDNISCISISQDLKTLHPSSTSNSPASIPSSNTDSPPMMMTGSWDQTARVYHLLPDPKTHSNQFDFQEKYLLKGHKAAVWSVAIVSREREEFLTSSADLFVRLFNGEEMIRIFTGHTDVVRGITLLQVSYFDSKMDSETVSTTASTSTTTTLDSDHQLTPLLPSEPLFLTSSNDTTLQLHSLAKERLERPDRVPGNGGGPLRLLKGSRSLVYESCWMKGFEDRSGAPSSSPDDETTRKDLIVASCGEDGEVRIWNCDDESLIDIIPQPVLSVWSIAYLPISGDLVTGSSDGLVRIYTRRPKEPNAVEAGEVSEEELKEHQEACEKIQQARNGPHSEIIASNDNLDQSGSKQLHSDGSLYDSILQIDVSDDYPPLELGINKGDDPKSKAQEFIEKNKLPESYLIEIVQFIEMVGPK